MPNWFEDLLTNMLPKEISTPLAQQRDPGVIRRDPEVSWSQVRRSWSNDPPAAAISKTIAALAPYLNPESAITGIGGAGQAISMPAFKEALRQLLSSGSRERALQYAERVPQKFLDPISEVTRYRDAVLRAGRNPDEVGRAFDRGVIYNMGGRSPYIGLSGEATYKTPFHEVAHDVYYRMPEEIRNMVDNIYGKLTVGELRSLQLKMDTSLHNPSEMFSEAYARFITEDAKFKNFPKLVQDIVKSYHNVVGNMP
jgi:hypothetical protein